MSFTVLMTAMLIGPVTPSSTDDWIEEYRATMVATTERAKASPDEAVPRLIAVYTQLEDRTDLPSPERRRMRRSLEGRLVKQLEHLVREKRQSDRASRLSLDGGGPNAVAAQQFIDLIVNTIAPDSWRQNGGAGSISYYPNNPALVIRQSQNVHEQVAELLQALR
ncbi:MAG: hypothetical protein JSS49_03780 [Planctomycetes bacterium]|nr:hypothetical protein [Planctomycetota bacterium]